MNSNAKGALLFVGGAAVGALAVYALTKGVPGFKPLLANVMAGGLEIRDKLLGVMDQAKENMEDLIAEAENSRKQAAQTAEAPAAESQTS